MKHAISPIQLSAVQAEAVHRVLAYYKARDLGDGDISAGANLLAIHAATICNLHPNPHIADLQGRRHAAGLSLTICGDLTPALAREKCFVPLLDQQNNVTMHHHDWREHLDRKEKKIPLPKTPEGLNPMTPSAVPNLGEFLKPSIVGQQPVSLLLDSTADTQRSELHNRPLVCIHASFPAQLLKALPLIHQARPLVIIRPQDVDAIRSFGPIGGALVNGGLALEARPGTTYRGRVCLEIAPGILSELLSTGDSSTAWAFDTLWFHDGDAGSLLPHIQQPQAVSGLDNMERRIKSAVKESWSSRFGCDLQAERECFDIGEAQWRWTNFITRFEAISPGIAIATRSLFPTLLFGLSKINDAPIGCNDDEVSKERTIRLMRASSAHPDFGGMPSNVLPFKKLGIALADLLEFARFLVIRMVNARQATTGAAQYEVLQELATRISYKLDQAPLTHRQLVRKTNKLSTIDCLAALHLLERAGAVVRDDDLRVLTTSPADACQRIITANGATIDV